MNLSELNDDILIAYAEGKLDEKQHAQVEAILESAPDLKAKLDEMQRLDKSLRSTLTALDRVPTPKAQILAGIVQRLPPAPLDQGGTSPTELVRLAIQHFQRARSTWDATAQQPLEHEKARLQLRLAQDQLLSLIADSLLQVARQWIGSTFGRSLASVEDDAALMSLALTLYLEVIEELFNTPIDESKNPISLIKTIAHRRLTDSYRSWKRQPPVLAGWNLDNAAARGDTAEQDVVDPASIDLEEILVNRLYNKGLIAKIWDFWGSTLPPEEQLIMRRWEKDPPTPFKELAVVLGSGCTEGMIKMQHHRVIERTRKFLMPQQPP